MTDIFVAAVAAVAVDGISLVLPGAVAGSQKHFMRLSSASVAAGDQVLCARVSGTVVVLGKIE